MEAGLKDQPIYWESPTDTNNSGSVTRTWADAFGNSPPEADWARIISQRGKEAFEAGRSQTTRLIRACVDYRDTIKSTWRFKWLDEYYEVIDIDRSDLRNGNLWVTGRLVDAS